MRVRILRPDFRARRAAATTTPPTQSFFAHLLPWVRRVWPPLRHPPHFRRWHRFLLGWRAGLILLAAAFLLRAFAFLPAVIDTDEGLYMLQAREWLRGNWPLVAVWDMHPVGAPALFVLVIALFGEAIWATRLLGLLGTWATACGLYAMARAAGASPVIGFSAGFLYLGHTTLLGGLATNTEVLFSPLTAWAMALGVRALRRNLDAEEEPRWPLLIGMGLMIGTGLVIKPVVVFEGCLSWLLAVGLPWWRGLIPTRRLLLFAATYAIFCATPTVLFALAYALKGEFAAFLAGSFLAPLRYAAGRLAFADALRLTLIPAFILFWLLVLATIAVIALRRQSSAAALLQRIAVLWFAAATATVAMPGMFYQHYFLLWLPPLSLLAALGARRLARMARPRFVIAAFSVFITGAAIDGWRASTEKQLFHAIGLGRPDPVRAVAAALRREITPGDPVWVVNYHPAVYVLAEAGLATRYVFPAQLVGAYWRVTGTDPNQEVARILDSLPRALVIDRGWWPQVRPRIATMIEEALAEHYELAAVIPEDRGPVEVWRLR